MFPPEMWNIHDCGASTITDPQRCGPISVFERKNGNPHFPLDCRMSSTIVEPQRCTSTIVEQKQRFGFHNRGANPEEERFCNRGATMQHKANVKKEKERVHEDNVNGANSAKKLTGHIDNFSSPMQLT